MKFNMEKTELQVKQLALLDDTVNYYSADPSKRCSDGIDCFYSPTSMGVTHSDGCAIGRLLTPELRIQLDKDYVGEGMSDRVFALLPENVRYYGIEFLSALQDLHDCYPNWNKDGISTLGLSAVQGIKETFGLD